MKHSGSSQFQKLALAVLATFLIQFGRAATVVLPSASDVWLAGMPDGTSDGARDFAPLVSPPQVLGVPIVPGSFITFSAVGTTAQNHNSASFPPVGPDGTALLTDHVAVPQSAISDVTAPYSSLIGVFLGPNLPSLTPAPIALDFTSLESRNYTNLAPLLKQVFFIGDGFATNSVVQTVTVPPGATRLFLGTMDGQFWYDNAGSLSVEISTTGLATNVASVIAMYPGISFSGIVGLSYQIEYASSLGNSNVWSNLTTLILPYSPYTHCDATATNAPMRFYRVAQLP